MRALATTGHHAIFAGQPVKSKMIAQRTPPAVI
jgi:hypothetical protein